MRKKLKKIRLYVRKQIIKLCDLSDKITEVEWLYFEKNKKIFLNEKYENIPKIIWIYWDSVEDSSLVDLCINQVKYVCPEYEINILNSSNIENFIGVLPDFSSDLPIANISDYIRLALLTKFGGIWMDASVFLTENLDWIFNKIRNYDAFVFYTDDCTLDLRNPITETWFIVAPKGSHFIKKWFEEYSRCITSNNPKKYYSEFYFNKEIIQNIGNPEYLICYISAILVLRRNNYNILYARSGSVGHYYNYKFSWNSEFIATVLMHKAKDRIFVPKMIKFTNATRDGVEMYIKKSKFKKNSLLGEALIRFRNLDY